MSNAEGAQTRAGGESERPDHDHLYAGATQYENGDLACRDNYAAQIIQQDVLSNNLKSMYGRTRKSAVANKAGEYSKDAQATFAEFLGHLNSHLSSDSTSISRKLGWMSLEYFFTSASDFFLDKNLLSFEYRFYCASALAAVDTIVEQCESEGNGATPYVFIVTTQSPAEYFPSKRDNKNSTDGFWYDAARVNYRESFAKKIRDRGSKALIVERHYLVTRDCPSVRHLRCDQPPGNWGAGSDGVVPSIKKSDTDNGFVQWLEGNHHWHVSGDEPLYAGVGSYINVVEAKHLPINYDQLEPSPPKDDNMCIDAIVFGVARKEPGETDIEVQWRFGIGVFDVVKPENLQGRFIKLFSGNFLMGTEPFPFLGYEAQNFRSLFSMLKSDSGQPSEKSLFVHLGKSGLLTDSPPFSDWLPDDRKPRLMNRIPHTVRQRSFRLRSDPPFGERSGPALSLKWGSPAAPVGGASGKEDANGVQAEVIVEKPQSAVGAMVSKASSEVWESFRQLENRGRAGGELVMSLRQHVTLAALMALLVAVIPFSLIGSILYVQVAKAANWLQLSNMPHAEIILVLKLSTILATVGVLGFLGVVRLLAFLTPKIRLGSKRDGSDDERG
jgi:hypothetical protein